MNINISLLLCSSFIICATLIYLIKKWPDLDVVDLYITFIALHFGIYPFIRSLCSGKDMIFDLTESNPVVIALVFLHILLIMGIIRLISAYFPQHINNYLKIRPLVDRWSAVNNYIIFILYFWLILYQIISYYKYGVKSYILPDEFDKLGKVLPYWFMSMRTIYNYLVFSVFIALVAKATVAKKHSLFLWLGLILILLPFGSYYGRRFFVNIIVTGVIFWLVKKEDNILQLKYLKIAAIMVISFIFVSNIYQTYRENLQIVGVSLRNLKNPISAALNFKATFSNLQNRPGTWQFSYLVLDKQVSEPVMKTTDGRISKEGFKASIPRFIWPAKKFFYTDEIVANLYGVTMKDVDIGKNIFGLAQLEFGYLSIIVVPFIILLINIMMAGLVKVTASYPIFMWLFSGNIINYLINIEENGNEIFYMIRNLVALIIIFVLLCFNKEIMDGHEG